MVKLSMIKLASTMVGLTTQKQATRSRQREAKHFPQLVKLARVDRVHHRFDCGYFWLIYVKIRPRLLVHWDTSTIAWLLYWLGDNCVGRRHSGRIRQWNGVVTVWARVCMRDKAHCVWVDWRKGEYGECNSHKELSQSALYDLLHPVATLVLGYDRFCNW